MFSKKNLKLITQVLLLSVIVIIPFLRTFNLYFPYASGKAYLFRSLVSFTFFFWVWLMQKEQSEKRNAQNPFLIFKNILVVSLILFFLAQVLVSFFGADPLLSFFSTLDRADGVLQYGFWLLYFLMLISVFKKEQDWKLFFYVFIIVAVLLSLYDWLVYYTPNVRSSGLFGNSSYSAIFLLFAIGFHAIAIERKFVNNYFLKGLFLILAIFFIITLIALKSRGVYLGFVGGFFLFCLLSVLFLRKEQKKFALFCGIILVVGLALTITLFSLRNTNFVQRIYILKYATEITESWQSDSVRERFLIWQIALKAFKEKPIFGWGPENFGSAVNKYYDYRVGMTEPWFDRAHSHPIDTLATGGVTLFSFYLFFLGAVIYTIFKISRQNDGEKKVLSFILASIFLAYFLQGLFIFDTLPTFLGLFPFLAYLVYLNPKSEILNPKQITNSKSQITNSKQQTINYKILIPAGILSLFIIWVTVFIPYKANVLALKFSLYLENGIYEKAKPFLEQSYNIKSPYVFWEVRKKSAWELANVLGREVNEKTIPKDLDALKNIYDYITPELEKFVQNKPYDPQIYYILGGTYRLGFEKLGKNDLAKAESVLKKGLNYSDSRLEYYNELVQVLVFEEKFDEGESLITEYSKKLSSNSKTGYDYYNYNNVILGNFYLMVRKNDLAWEHYEKARGNGYQFNENDLEYSRYAFLAEERGEYQRIVDVSLDYLEKWGPDADIFYNVAVGYLNLEEKERAREFFLKAVELKPEYEEYRSFFENF